MIGLPLQRLPISCSDNGSDISSSTSSVDVILLITDLQQTISILVTKILDVNHASGLTGVVYVQWYVQCNGMSH